MYVCVYFITKCIYVCVYIHTQKRVYIHFLHKTFRMRFSFPLNIPLVSCQMTFQLPYTNIKRGPKESLIEGSNERGFCKYGGLYRLKYD